VCALSVRCVVIDRIVRPRRRGGNAKALTIPAILGGRGRGATA
jgi:hypothetical protein